MAQDGEAERAAHAVVPAARYRQHGWGEVLAGERRAHRSRSQGAGGRCLQERQVHRNLLRRHEEERLK